MKNEEKKEELQSRRDFFKNAAKATLPVIGAIVLASVPTVAKAETAPMGCNNACSFGCGSECVGNCDGSCKGTCRGTCDGGCMRTCYTACSGGSNIG